MPTTTAGIAERRSQAQAKLARAKATTDDARDAFDAAIDGMTEQLSALAVA